MKTWMLAAMLFLASLPALARAPADPDEAGIRQVIERFRTAIIERDKPRFMALFLEGGVSWQPTLSDEGLSRIREKNPKAIKLRVNPANNPTSFIDEVVAAATELEAGDELQLRQRRQLRPERSGGQYEPARRGHRRRCSCWFWPPATPQD